MKRKIVADSSADLNALDQIPYTMAPMIIHTGKKSYLDDGTLDIESMVADLLQNRGKTSSACPGIGDWLDAFGDSEEVFCLTITSRLSGSYSSACMAKQEYEEA
ncbi:MAG: DegV family protein, partial [Oscillospiraceae bacterium]|nr:DegV family protein [Oscillospiraceae bacterium]